MKEWFEMDRQQNKQLAEWERSRIIKHCKTCGQPYSYEKGTADPKECQSCRGEEGELIY